MLRRVTAFILIAAFAALFVVAAVGCSPEQMAQAVEQAKQTRAATTQAVADTEAALAELPPGDPVRVEGEKQVAKLKKAVERIDGAIAGLEHGDTAALREATRDIPYSNHVISIGMLAYGIWKRGQLVSAMKALRQTVKGVQNAKAVLPSPQAEQLDAALAGAQDGATKVLITKAKVV